MEKQAGKHVIKVLVAIDGSPISDLVLQHCARYAKMSGCDLTLLHVIEDIVPLSEVPNTPLRLEREKEGAKILADAERILKDQGLECKTLLVEGPVAQQIVNVAEENGVDYIFMGSRGLRGIKRMLLGSVADSVTRYAHCAVTIIR
ncbi:MAG: universal stress protein [Syntrophobacterales bacterium]|nr:universal stress protein [Syntrophobacterales bacterium]